MRTTPRRTDIKALPARDREDTGVGGATMASMAQATNTKRSLVERRRAAIDATRGMFAHLAPGVSLSDELIADRRAEVRAEEAADEAQRRRGES